MAPITTQDSSFDLQSDTVLRARWDEREIDHKAVGGHLPLAKRLSTPLRDNNNPLTTSLQHNVSSASVIQAHNAVMQHQALINLELSQHRKLDRSLSEPVRQAIQQQQPTQGNSSRYKTELCRPYDENGFCKYGDKCQFAHGNLELRTMSRHPKYKTELCRTYHSSGFCPYGARCHFVHGEPQQRVPSHPPLTATTSLNLGSTNLNFPNISNYLGSTAESPSPPSSLHGSPTLFNGNTFFDEAFARFPNGQTLVESITGSLSPASKMAASLGNLKGLSTQLAEFEYLRENQLISIPGLDTPPFSPVESLAGDVDSLSLSSAPSDSPVPSTQNGILDLSRGLGRLPIFERLSEDSK